MKRRKCLDHPLTPTAEVERQQEEAGHARPRVDRFPWLSIRDPAARHQAHLGFLAKFFGRDR